MKKKANEGQKPRQLYRNIKSHQHTCGINQMNKTVSI